MRLITRTLLAGSASLALLAGGMAPAAQAVAPAAPVVAKVVAKKAAPVTIRTIANKKVSGSAKVTVKPSVKLAAGTKASSVRITVKKGSRTVAKNVKSVRLGAGTYKVTTTVKYKVKSSKATKTASKTQTLKITKKAAPKGWAYSDGSWNCPSGYPIKGNESSMIYHVPGGAYYGRTNPERCFSSASEARKAGFRASQR